MIKLDYDILEEHAIRYLDDYLKRSIQQYLEMEVRQWINKNWKLIAAKNKEKFEKAVENVIEKESISKETYDSIKNLIMVDIEKEARKNLSRILKNKK